MASLPVHPRLAHMILVAHKLGALKHGCLLAALLSERDILRGQRTGADVQLRMDALQQGQAFTAGGDCICACWNRPAEQKQLRLLL